MNFSLYVTEYDRLDNLMLKNKRDLRYTYIYWLNRTHSHFGNKRWEVELKGWLTAARFYIAPGTLVCVG